MTYSNDSDSYSIKETWFQREFLYPEVPLIFGGFTTKPYYQLALKQPPCTKIKSTTRQRLLSPWKGASQHSWGFHTWLDVGRLPPVFPTRPDKPYESNVWRWLTRAKVHKCALPHYTVPPPSRLGKNTFLHYIDTRPIFTDPVRKERAITKTKKEVEEAAILKLKSEVRVPPLNAQGNIVPPKNFVRYKHVTRGGRLDPKGFQLVPTPVPTLFCKGWPCPNPQPHYKEMTLKLVLQPSPPLNPQMVRDYQILAKNRATSPICYVTGKPCVA